MLRSLFGAMTKGGLFGADLIEWFNGGLFDSDETIPLQPDDIREILSVARLDWSAIEPSVFGRDGAKGNGAPGDKPPTH